MDATITNPANGSIIDLPIDLIQNGHGTEVRTPDPVVYMEYRDRIIAGDEFPPIDAFWDGNEFIMGDGRHRFYGHREANCKTIKAKIHHGTADDALWFAAGSNQAHGKRRTNVDKRDAVKALLLSKKFVKFSDSKLSEQAAVDHKTVASIRKELEATGEIPKLTERIGNDGKSRRAPVQSVAARKLQAIESTVEPIAEGKSPSVDLVAAGITEEMIAHARLVLASCNQDLITAVEQHEIELDEAVQQVPCPHCGATDWTTDDMGTFCDSCKDAPVGLNDRPVETLDAVDDEPALSDLILATQKVLVKLVDKCPPKFRQALGNRLRIAAEELIERGDIRR